MFTHSFPANQGAHIPLVSTSKAALYIVS